MERMDAVPGPRQRTWHGQIPILGVGLAVLGLVLWSVSGFGWRHSALLVVGVLMGLTLYVTAFGFTTGYRRAVLLGDVDSVDAQLVMLAVAMVLFAPILSGTASAGLAVTGAYAPVGPQVAIGAFLFGVGMQLGGGCGSGTLYGAGGGSTRTLVTLAAFCGGAFWASLQLDAWNRLPSVPAIVLGDRLGWPVAIVLQLAMLAGIWLVMRGWSRRRRLHLTPVVGGPAPAGPLTPRRVLIGGALTLAGLNFATLLLAGHPWTITWGYTLWAARAADAAGWDPALSPFWSGGMPAAALAGPVLRDVTSLMNVGIMLGAMGAAATLGRFRPKLRVPARSLAGAVIGGLLLGYGSRIAFGCNIGAFFSGVASTSLHGWVWIAAAVPGTWLGVRLRPWFGLGNEDTSCPI